MCDLGMLGQLVRVALGLPAVGSSAGKSAMLQATSDRHAAEPLSATEVAEEVNNLTVNTEHLMKKSDACMQQIAQIVETGRSTESVSAVVRLVKEKRGYQVKIRNNRTRISNLEEIHGKLSDSSSNSRYTSIVNRAGYQLKRQNPDEAVDRIENTMVNLKEGIENAERISNALNEDVQSADLESEQSVLDEVKKLFDDAEKRKMGSVLAAAAPTPLGPLQVHTPPSTAATPGRPLALSISSAPMPIVVKQTPQVGGVPSVPRPRPQNTMQDFTNV